LSSKRWQVEPPKAQVSIGNAAYLPMRLRVAAATVPPGIRQRFVHSASIFYSERADLLVSLTRVRIYRGFPQRLHHRVPHWVEPGALFHIRIALDRGKVQTALTESTLGRAILDSAKFYEAKMRWHITLFLLMPDHLHALLSFALAESMSDVIRDWKRFHTRSEGVAWQE
jgi:hypothetical protein